MYMCVSSARAVAVRADGPGQEFKPVGVHISITLCGSSIIMTWLRYGRNGGPFKRFQVIRV
jgi:hypothetical protein